MSILLAFLMGGVICTVAQILIDKTKLTPARILVSYVVLGVVNQPKRGYRAWFKTEITLHTLLGCK